MEPNDVRSQKSSKNTGNETTSMMVMAKSMPFAFSIRGLAFLAFGLRYAIILPIPIVG
jgi:hypothetical protein